MKAGMRKRLNTERFLKTNESVNSFLVETSFNSDIDMSIRNEIDKKFYRSKINSEYIFPRIETHKKSQSKQLSNKPSLENLGKFIPSHKITKSAIHPLLSDLKISDKTITRRTNIPLKIPANLKVEERKTGNRVRGQSYRQIKTERNQSSKSPKQKRNFMEIYSKNTPMACKKSTNTELMNKIFTPINSNTKLLNTAASMRLKKIYHNVKHNAF